ncbi:hypothetical protein TrVE_jg10432 [Triparma verrucosa]|uniref:Uncharacterized protein n=1 Tax=Triparma verrucosa TaxID=1606542 RepID=A0A9W7C456_9STRA|nr:hypothetical protein TrVE_jg10432 [Triparma verrucosa]
MSLSVSRSGQTTTLTFNNNVVLLSVGACTLLGFGSAVRYALQSIQGRKKGRKGEESGGWENATKGDDFREWGGELLKWVTDYRDKCRDIHVISRVEPNYLQKGLPSSAPTTGEPWTAIMSDLDSKILPGLTHWEASNRFFAYFKPHASYPAVLGEMLCAGLNVMGFDWIASPACTELEVVTLDWLGRFLNLPEKFLGSSEGPGGGVIQGSAGESATVVLLAAAVSKQKLQPERTKMVVYVSDQTHAIAQKATMILGIRCHVVKTALENNFEMQAADLEAAIEEDVANGLCPIAAVATTGTTSSCAFDPLVPISAVCKAREMWVHVDAAYGGAYACLEAYKSKFEGLEEVDSFCVNCHKKLLCPFDIAALYVANRRPILDALSLQPEYLRNAHSESGAVVDFEHWQMPLGRRFRSLKLWFVMRRFGTEGLRHHVQNGTVLAKYFASLVEKDEDLEISVPVSLSLVCFRWKGRGEADQQRLLDAVKATGKAFIIHTKLGGKIVIRVACGGVEQTKDDVLGCYEVISRELKKLK